MTFPERMKRCHRPFAVRSSAETSELLDISEETVKTRLHRARHQLRNLLTESIGAQVPQLFDFHLSRCDRVVARVFARIGIER